MNPDAPGTPAPGEVIPPTPPAPVEPPAAVVEPPAADQAPDAAAEADAKEWGDAENEIFPGLTKVNKDADDPATTTTTTTQAPETTTTTTTEQPATTTTTTTVDPSETPEQKAEREQREADAAAAADESDESDEPDNSPYAQRRAAREYAKQVELVAVDVRDTLYKDAPTVLTDGDGDPIRSLEDVMAHTNLRTGEPFTEEEAGIWLLNAQQKFNKEMADREKHIEQVSETLVDLKEQSDAVNRNYGEILKADQKLAKEIWADYDATLIKDKATGLIIGAPVSIERFYDRALRPYVDAAAAPGAATPPPVGKTAEELKAEADAKKIADDAAAAARRADRSDIYAGGANKDVLTDDDKEWADAEKVVYGSQLPGSK